MSRMQKQPLHIGPRYNPTFNLIKNILLLVLLVAVIGLGLYAISANRSQGEMHKLFLQKAQVECSDAMTLAATLSRTAGSNSSETLGIIRAKVYAIDTLSSIGAALNGPGDRLVPESWFTNFYTTLSNYSAQLLKGMNTSSNQNEVTTALNELAWRLSNLQ